MCWRLISTCLEDSISFPLIKSLVFREKGEGRREVGTKFFWQILRGHNTITSLQRTLGHYFPITSGQPLDNLSTKGSQCVLPNVSFMWSIVHSAVRNQWKEGGQRAERKGRDKSGIHLVQT